MQEFYIKTPSNQYCLIQSYSCYSTYLYFIPYLLNNLHLIDKKDKQKFLDNVKAFKDYEDKQLLGDIVVLSYKGYKDKPMIHSYNTFTLNEIKENYIKLKELSSLYTMIERELKKHIILFDSLSAKELKPYFYYEKYADIFFDTICHENKERLKNVYSYPEEDMIRWIKKVQYLSNKKLENIKVKQLIPEEYQYYLSNPFKKLLKQWNQVLDEKGNIKHIEENGPISRFNDSIRYAIFLQNKETGEQGYFKSHRNYFVNIDEAKIYKYYPNIHNMLINTERYIVSIVKIKIEFQQVSRILNENYDIDSHTDNALYTLKAHQEKNAFNTLLNNKDMNQVNSPNEIKAIKLLLTICEDEYLKQQLKEYLKIQETKKVKNNKKI